MSVLYDFIAEPCDSFPSVAKLSKESSFKSVTDSSPGTILSDLSVLVSMSQIFCEKTCIFSELYFTCIPDDPLLPFIIDPLQNFENKQTNTSSVDAKKAFSSTRLNFVNPFSFK